MKGELAQKFDSVAERFTSYAQNILVVIFGLLPLLFIPTIVAPFEYTKVLVVIAGLLVALVLYSLSVLRSGVLHVGFSLPLCALWVTAGIAFVSSLLSGDLQDSLVGDLFSTQSTLFVALLALIPTVWMMLRAPKSAVINMYLLLAGSTLVLVVFHISRLIFGSTFLSLGVFTSAVSTPVGTWNDLGLFLGLSIILSLVVLELLTLTRVGRALFVFVTITALIMLGVINFFTVWIVLGLTSLVMIVYTLGKDRLPGSQLSLIRTKGINTASFAVSLLVFVVSVFFIVGGSTVGGWVAQLTNVSYVEVRPSLEATSNIARYVYQDNAFLGIGTNKFIDAWRLYKDSSINSTPFWNTDFVAGNGYVTTFFVTTGVLGGLAWFAFIIMYFVTGLRRLLGGVSEEEDKVWYFIGVSSFVSAVYIWGMSVLYVPGVTILLIGAVCTGVSLYAFSILAESTSKMINVGSNRKTGFILTVSVIVTIVVSVSLLYITGRHYSAVYAFNESVRSMQSGTPIGDLEQEVVGAYALSSSDVFARRIAEYQLARLNSLSGVVEPTEEQSKEFNDAAINGIRFAQEAIKIDSLEPANWSVLAGIYNVLASINVEGAQSRAQEALAKSRELNPKNPLPYLESAIVEARSGSFDTARDFIQKSIALKADFTEAYYILSQIEIAEGNVEAAIRSTKAAIALEPRNPIRVYQLGVLESSQNNVKAAILSFEKAVQLDSSYANARYLLALAYDLEGRSNEAREQLQKVLDLNPGNSEVTQLIQVIDSEGSLKRLRAQVKSTVQETLPTVGDAGDVSSAGNVDSALITPVNTPPKNTESSETLNE